ncbi:MAG TPA: hypothetical protein VF599_12405 [Pyrinomonadaceae bacterium]|jgi:hypothetical protein
MKPEKSSPQSNIAFVGKKDGREPILSITNGETVIVLPTANAQSKPFYHPNAKTIVRLFPELYKPVRQR